VALRATKPAPSLVPLTLQGLGFGRFSGPFRGPFGAPKHRFGVLVFGCFGPVFRCFRPPGGPNRALAGPKVLNWPDLGPFRAHSGPKRALFGPLSGPLALGGWASGAGSWSVSGPFPTLLDLFLGLWRGGPPGPPSSQSGPPGPQRGPRAQRALLGHFWVVFGRLRRPNPYSSPLGPFGAQRAPKGPFGP